MTQPMRLMELVTNFLPGGIQRHALDLTAYLRAQGHSVTLAGDSGDWADDQTVHLQLNNVTWRGGSPLKRAAALWPCARILRKAVRAGNIQVIHAHETAPAIVARLATLGLDVPVVLTFHGSAPNRETGVARTARFCADLTLSPSKDGIERLVGHGLPRDKARATGLGIAPMPHVPPEQAAALRQQLLNGRDGPVILSLSRLDHQKGIDVMVKVAAQVIEKAPGATFVIAGKGPEQDKVQAWAKAAGVSDAMRFIGPISTVPLHLAAADIFLLTSRWENLPISIVEAFRAGLPVVATDCGGVRELVDNTVGALTPVADAAASANALLHLIQNPTARAAAGSAALARSRESRFTPDAVHAQFEQLYADLLDKT